MARALRRERRGSRSLRREPRAGRRARSTRSSASASRSPRSSPVMRHRQEHRHENGLVDREIHDVHVVRCDLPLDQYRPGPEVSGLVSVPLREVGLLVARTRNEIATTLVTFDGHAPRRSRALRRRLLQRARARRRRALTSGGARAYGSPCSRHPGPRVDRAAVTLTPRAVAEDLVGLLEDDDDLANVVGEGRGGAGSGCARARTCDGAPRTHASPRSRWRRASPRGPRSNRPPRPARDAREPWREARPRRAPRRRAGLRDAHRDVRSRARGSPR